MIKDEIFNSSITFSKLRNEINPNYLERNITSLDINKCSIHLESMVAYCQENLLKDKFLNYQSKMKEIQKIIDYCLQISETKNF